MNPTDPLPATRQPQISVIMPVYNGAALLDRSIRSVRAQTFTDWELLAVDDRSTDDSYEHLCRHAASDPRIHAFRFAENHGTPSAARNQALRHARGQIITYLDQDDEYYPDFLSHVQAWQACADVLVFAIDIVEADQGVAGAGPVRTWDPTPVRTRLLQEGIINPLEVAHRRALLETVGLFEEEKGWLFAEDWDFWKRLARSGAAFLFLPLKSGRYHVLPDSLLRRRRRYQAMQARWWDPSPAQVAEGKSVRPGAQTFSEQVGTLRTAEELRGPSVRREGT
jgi:hypothetical protein